MEISKRGLDLIKQFEGCVLHVYKDSVGVDTVGFGSTQYENGISVKMGDPSITIERADELLNFEAKDKAHTLNQALQKYNIILNQDQFDGLCSFAYNVGITGLLTSALFRKIKKNPNDPSIKDEFMRWNKGHAYGKVIILKALTYRRAKEADVYFSNPIT